ncbi:hypothetical protein [Fodinicola feengrottensis]|uniref:hypothetical protein n=1 Tax=Fodinicola feengrottensis TaxID=435914 RepID=UPI0013D0DD7E|nr:hypothetical protein [Fodinicola feengrottensis]
MANDSYRATVLLIVHNVTTLTRLLDILPVFDSDPRIQLVASWNSSDPFSHGLTDLIDDIGVVAVPWEQARHTAFDLAVAASHHGSLTDIGAPLVIISHGIGYTKNWLEQRAASSEQRAASSEQRAANSEQRTDFRALPAMGSLQR